GAVKGDLASPSSRAPYRCMPVAQRLELRRWTAASRPTRCNRRSGFDLTSFPLLPTHQHFCYSVPMFSISTRHMLASRQGVYDVAESTPAIQTSGTSPHRASYQALQLTHRSNLPELDQALYPVSWQAPSP